MAAILDLPVIPTSESVHRSLTVLIDANIVGVAIEFPLFKICNSSCMCFRYYIRHFDFRFYTVRIQPGVTLWAAKVSSKFSKISEATLYSFPWLKYASSFEVCQNATFWLNISSTLLRFRCPHLMTGWTTFRCLNVILLGLNGPKNVPKRNKNAVGPWS